jgi:hypothetical protein
MAWYSPNYKYRQQITISKSMVNNGDQSNFPVLVKLTDAGNTIFTHALASGNDLLFTAADGVTLINAEIEYFSQANHELDAWVFLTTLSASVDTVIYLYYGNAAATGYTTAQKQAVWGNGYVGVWHMNQTGTGTIGDYKDSTSFNNNGGQSTNEPNITTGKIGQGQLYNGIQNASGSYISVPDATSLNQLSAFSLSVWVFLTGYGYSLDGSVFIGKPFNNIGDAAKTPFLLYYLSVDAVGCLNTSVASGVNGTRTVYTATQSIPLNSWHYLTGTWSGTRLDLYLDGAPMGSGVATTQVMGTTPHPLMLGGWGAFGYTDITKGSLDEIRVANIYHSAAWIATEYNNQSAPSTYLTFGAEIMNTILIPNMRRVNGSPFGPITRR